MWGSFRPKWARHPQPFVLNKLGADFDNKLPRFRRICGELDACHAVTPWGSGPIMTSGTIPDQLSVRRRLSASARARAARRARVSPRRPLSGYSPPLAPVSPAARARQRPGGAAARGQAILSAVVCAPRRGRDCAGAARSRVAARARRGVLGWHWLKYMRRVVCYAMPPACRPPCAQRDPQRVVRALWTRRLQCARRLWRRNIVRRCHARACLLHAFIPHIASSQPSLRATRPITWALAYQHLSVLAETRTYILLD